jgi:hypothetical protein
MVSKPRGSKHHVVKCRIIDYAMFDLGSDNSIHNSFHDLTLRHRSGFAKYHALGIKNYENALHRETSGVSDVSCDFLSKIV